MKALHIFKSFGFSTFFHLVSICALASNQYLSWGTSLCYPGHPTALRLVPALSNSRADDSGFQHVTQQWNAVSPNTSSAPRFHVSHQGDNPTWGRVPAGRQALSGGGLCRTCLQLNPAASSTNCCCCPENQQSFNTKTMHFVMQSYSQLLLARRGVSRPLQDWDHVGKHPTDLVCFPCPDPAAGGRGAKPTAGKQPADHWDDSHVVRRFATRCLSPAKSWDCPEKNIGICW